MRKTSAPFATATLALALLTALAAVPTQAEDWPHTRDGWLLGFDLGYGTVGVDIDGVDETSREGGFAWNARGAHVVNPDLYMGFEANGVFVSVDDETQSFTVWAFAVTYYPGSGPWYLRGGLGIGTGSFREASQGPGANTSTKTGMGLLAAAGYEFRLTRQFALAPQIDFSWANLDPSFKANYFIFSAAFNFYLDTP